MSSLLMRRVMKRRPTAPPADPAFKLTIDTTKAGSAADTFILPLPAGFTYDCVIDWGDGTEAVTTSGNKSHTWATGGVKQIAITGTLPTIRFLNASDTLKAISIDNWGTMPWLSLRESFRGCANLNSIAEGGNFLGVADAFAAWFGCSSLTTFPSLTFSFGAGTLSLSYLCQGCTGLTTFNAFVFVGSGDLSLTHLCYGCSGLTSFPEIDCSNATAADFAWYGCSGLTSFPALDFSRVRNLGSAWYGCNKLTSFPAISTPLCTTFSDCWRECTELLSFPALNIASATTLYAAWYNCGKIVTAPEAVITNPTSGTLTLVSYAFWGNTARLGNSYPFWAMGTPPTGTTLCYGVCTGLTDYATIPAAYK